MLGLLLFAFEHTDCTLHVGMLLLALGPLIVLVSHNGIAEHVPLLQDMFSEGNNIDICMQVIWVGWVSATSGMP